MTAPASGLASVVDGVAESTPAADSDATHYDFSPSSRAAHGDSQVRAHRRGWLVRRMLLVADLAGLTAAFAGTEIMLPDHRIALVAKLLVFAASLPAWIVMAKIYGLYSRDEERAGHSTVDDTVGVFHLVTVGTWLLLFGTWLAGLGYLQLGRVAVFWIIAVVAITAARAVARALCRRTRIYVQRAILVGASEIAHAVERRVRNHPEYGLSIVGVVDRAHNDTPERGLLGPPEALRDLCEDLDIERVIIAFPSLTEPETLDLIRSLEPLDVQVDLVPSFYELLPPGASIHRLEFLPLIGMPPVRLSRSSLDLKRTLDVTLAMLALVLLAPLFLIVALLIRLDSTGPVFYRQSRMGKDDRVFQMVKFRTMVVEADAIRSDVAHLNSHAQGGVDSVMFKIDGDPRVTRIGRLLRRYYLDELPQLINVVRGEMSLVGPRPLILDEDAHVGSWARRRLKLKPGMTGLWQVLGGPVIAFDEMVQLDYLYVTNWSLATDLRLLAKTVPLVLSGGGRSY